MITGIIGIRNLNIIFDEGKQIIFNMNIIRFIWIWKRNRKISNGYFDMPSKISIGPLCKWKKLVSLGQNIWIFQKYFRKKYDFLEIFLWEFIFDSNSRLSTRMCFSKIENTISNYNHYNSNTLSHTQGAFVTTIRGPVRILILVSSTLLHTLHYALVSSVWERWATRCDSYAIN